MSLSLYDYQKTHVRNISKCFEKTNVVYDTSDVGSGKTYSSLAYISEYNKVYQQVYANVYGDVQDLIRSYHDFTVYIVCPLSLVSKWQELWDLYISDKNITCHIMTYKKFLLSVRVDELLNETIFILDEGHILRNTNQTSVKMQQLFSKCQFKLLILSSTLLDKDEQESRFKHVFKMTGDNMTRMVFHPDIRIKTTIHTRINEEKDANTIVNGYDILRSLCYDTQDDPNNPHLRDNMQMAKLCKGLLTIHKGMVNTSIRLARELLVKEDNKIKLIIITPFIKVMESIYKDLKRDYGCAVMNGNTSAKSRTEIVEQFGQSNFDLQILITSFQVGSVGIDLDDKDGHINRHTIILPTYNTIDIYQMIGRTRRASTKSIPYIHFLEARCASKFVMDRTTQKMRKLSEYAATAIPQSIIDAREIIEEGPIVRIVQRKRKKKN